MTTSFAKRLAAAREAKGLTRTQLARRSGVNTTPLYRLEMGLTEPTWETVQRLARALGVPVTVLADPDLELPEAGPVPEREPEPEREPTIFARVREEVGLSQQELAERAGLSKQVVSSLDRGATRDPYWETVQRIARALGVEPERLADPGLVLPEVPEPKKRGPKPKAKPEKVPKKRGRPRGSSSPDYYPPEER